MTSESEVNLPSDTEEHEKEACEVAAMPSAIQGDLLSRQLEVSHSSNGELESHVARGAALEKSHRASRSSNPLNISIPDSDKALVAPPGYFDLENCNEATSLNNGKFLKKVSLPQSAVEQAFDASDTQAMSAGVGSRTGSLTGRELLENAAASDVGIHKRMLHSSLSQNSNDPLDGVARSTKSPSLNGDTKKRKRTFDPYLSQIPQFLSKAVTKVSEVKLQRSEYAALELEGLEEKTLQRHASPKHGDGATNKTVSLLYNECSLVAISNWVSGSISPLSGLLVDPGYRRCLDCKTWGHYESECLSRADGSLKSRVAVNRAYKQGEAQNDEQISQSGNLSGTESKYVVETCHGFVFEQRAFSARPNWNNEPLPEGYLAVSTIEIDGSPITSVKLDG